MVHARDVRELRQHAGGFVRHDVCGIAQIDHGAGELGEIVRLDAQLSGDGHDFGDVVRGGGDLRGHLLDLAGQGFVLRFRCVHSFPDGRERALVGHRRLDRRRAQREDGRGHGGGQRASGCRQRPGDRLALLAKGLQLLARRRPGGSRAGELLVGLVDLRSRGSHSGFGAVERGLGINNRIVCLTDLLRIVGLLGGFELFPRAVQGIFVLRYGLLLKRQLLTQQRQLGGEPCDAGIQLLDPCSGQLEAALGQGDLLAKGSDGRAAVLDGLACRIPIRLRQPQRLIALVDLHLRGLDGGTGFVEVGAGCAHRVRRILGTLLERRILSGEFFDLLHGDAVLGLECIQIGLGGEGRGIVLAQRGGKHAHLLRRRGNLFLERLLCRPGVRQALCVIRLAGEALLQLAVGSGEGAFVLRDGVLLEGQPPFQRGELGTQACSGLLKALDTRSSQLELALRLRDLLVHRADVPREVVRL